MLSFLLSGLFMLATPAPQDSSCPVSQGIAGTAYIVSGNRMPAPGVKKQPLPGIRTTIYIYTLTNISQVARDGQTGYYRSIGTKLVKEVQTDSLGHFCTALPAGRYSLFTRKNGLFYATRFDTDNNIFPVEVSTGKMTRTDCPVEGDRRPVY